MKKTSLLAWFLVLLLIVPVSAAQELVPGGQIIGLSLQEDGVTVAAFDDALGDGAKKAGLKIGDRIIQVNGETVHTAAEIRTALRECNGWVTLEVQRDSKNTQVKLEPAITSDGPKLGVYLREGISGIGTVTWYDPATGTFGSLGHGVNNAKGDLLEMTGGSAFAAQISAVEPGKSGQPGQLHGRLLSGEPVGRLTGNTTRGVFGELDMGFEGDAIPVAQADEVKTGPAIIRSTVGDGGVREYSVEILKIYPKDLKNGRNLLLKVTDPDLLAATGGIVQGMSGSPILQDGKLIGAVTHVLIRDASTGYGILIENMLQAAG